jgi:hypothetical protein
LLLGQRHQIARILDPARTRPQEVAARRLAIDFPAQAGQAPHRARGGLPYAQAQPFHVLAVGAALKRRFDMRRNSGAGACPEPGL